MKFTVGDKVTLKHTNEMGVILDFISDIMVEVEVRGISFPVYIDDLDHPYLKWFTEKKFSKPELLKPENLPIEKKPARRLSKGIYLSFLPVFKTEIFEEVVDYMKVFLLNELETNIKFYYDVKIEHKSDFTLEGNLHAFGNIYLHNIAYETMNDHPRFHWKATDNNNEKLETGEGILRIKPLKIFEHIEKLLKNNEPAFEYLLMEDFIPKKKTEPLEKYEPQPKLNIINLKSSIKTQPKYELDLHIEKLVPNKNGLTNADIIKIQLDTLEKYLHLAIMHRQELMIVIHGLGKGVLKEEVHKVLKSTPEVSRFKNEYSGKYGFGATEIWFRY